MSPKHLSYKERTEVSRSRDGSLSGEEGTRPQARNPAAYKTRAEDPGHTEGRPWSQRQRRPPHAGRREAGRPPCAAPPTPSPVIPTDLETQPSTGRLPDLPGAHLQLLSVRLNLPPARQSRNLRAARHKGTRRRRAARAGRSFQPTGSRLCLGQDARGRVFSASCPRSPKFC